MTKIEMLEKLKTLYETYKSEFNHDSSKCIVIRYRTLKDLHEYTYLIRKYTHEYTVYDIMWDIELGIYASGMCDNGEFDVEICPSHAYNKICKLEKEVYELEQSYSKYFNKGEN